MEWASCPFPTPPTPDSRFPIPDPPTLTLVGSSRMTDEAGKSYREGKARAIFLPDYSRQLRNL
ncbi:hypothetical protein [Moorena sp. SIO3H5]|uniref:hypothetical protein n=1 Tax=Moorena sp. SIO3H5 TaxID=2607834 RepID=UPI0013BDC7A7|nr:hypothetical protein [Moorena sp. SIO3H5]NEO73422.1 hypothetical protein [Moorena sp. SIO3H5]